MASMTTYQLSFSSSCSERAALGTVICASDAHAATSALRLLRNMNNFESVEVRDGERPVATLQRCDLAAA